jgi:hypothetical protein
MRILRPALYAAGVLAVGLAAACHAGNSGDSQPAKGVTTVYNKDTGRLEQIALDRDGDGKQDTRAYMDGPHLRYIEIDRMNRGRADRWEYYSPGASRGNATGALFDKNTTLMRAEEANGSDANQVTRWEYYDHGVIARVEEDTDADGHVDKWEYYEHGTLIRMDLDLGHTGKPDRRLVYRPDGTFDHLESDPTGDGKFTPIPAGAGAPGNVGTRGSKSPTSSEAAGS